MTTKKECFQTMFQFVFPFTSVGRARAIPPVPQIHARSATRAMAATVALLANLCLWLASSSGLAQTPLGGITQISAGSFHTCALTSGGGVKCWGYNNTGQLGNGSQIDAQSPVDVAGLTSGVIAIAAGGSHTCALTTGGGVKCWGLNQNGQLGDNGPQLPRLVPGDVPGLTSGVTAIAAGLLTTCALTTGGSAKCWGANGAGQLGDGTTVERPAPVDVVGLASGVRAIATYNGHSCAVTSGGGAKCWGQNNSGQLGIGFPPDPSLVPVDVISPGSSGLLSGASAITVSFASSCALASSGGVLCWGDNTAGQLGNNMFPSQSNKPASVLTGTALPPLAGVSAIAAGRNHVCALTTTSGVKCWGHNISGELGDNTNSQRNFPVDVIAGPALPPLSGVSAVTAGEQHTCALMNSGAVKCWGANFNGQLGDNSTAFYRFTPVDVVVPPPFLLNAVQSRKRHGALDFDLQVDTTPTIGGPVTVEPRVAGAGHLIVFQFNGLISATGSVSVVGSSGMPIGTPTITSSGNNVLVTLTGIADRSRATITLTGVNGAVNVSASIGFLVGDVNGSGMVEASDISAVKARSGQTTDATNFKFDVYPTGVINCSDILTAKAHLGLTLLP